MGMGYTIRQIRKRVYLVEAHSQYALCSMFMRPQEFYESPLEGIKGNYFSTEEFMDKYAATKPDDFFSYYQDWMGFNIPGEVLMKFFETFKHDYTAKEVELRDLVLGIVKNTDKPFYIVGTVEGENYAMQHELAHAYWYLFDEYRVKMEELLGTIEINMLNEANMALTKEGYDKASMHDEFQAYMATETKHTAQHYLGWQDYDKRKIPVKEFKEYFKEFDSKQEKI